MLESHMKNNSVKTKIKDPNAENARRIIEKILYITIAIDTYKKT